MSRAAQSFAAALLTCALAVPAFAQSSVNMPTTRTAISAQLDARFARLDQNMDGAITRAELGLAQKTGEQRLAQQLATNLGKEFSARDRNKDGALNSAEVGAGLGSQTNGAELFKVMDANKDGMVSRDEYLVPSRRVRAAADPAAQVKKFDTNGDGKVSLTEYKAGPLAKFDAADANKDGTVSPDEKRKVMAQRGR